MQLALQELRGTTQPAERVFDLVGELFDHQPAAVQAREQVVLARDALALRRVGQLEQQMGSGDLAFERGDRDIECTDVARGAGRSQGQLAFRESLARVERSAQDSDEAVGIMQKIAKRTAARLVETEGKQILRGDVRVNGAQLR